MIGAEEPGGVERLERADLPGPFHRLADRDERRHVGVLRARACGEITAPMCGIAIGCGGM